MTTPHEPPPRLGSTKRRRWLTGAGAVVAVAAIGVTTALLPPGSVGQLDMSGSLTKVPGWGTVTTDPGPEGACLVEQGLRGGEKAKAAAKWTGKEIGTNTFGFAQDELMGWGLHAALGSLGWEKDHTAEEMENLKTAIETTNENVLEVRAELGDLEKQVTDLRSHLDAKVDELKTDRRLGDLLSQKSQLDTYQTYYQDITAKAEDTPLDGTDTKRLADMRDGLPAIITNIRNVMDESIGEKSLPTLWNRAVWQNLGHSETDPPMDVMSADFVSDASLLTDYYSGVLIDAMRLDAEVNRVSFTHSGDNYPARPAEVCRTFIDVAKTINHFTDLSTRGVGHLPDNTVVDLRGSTPLLWSATPVRPEGGSGSSNYYCGTGAGYCYVKQYAALDDTGMHLDKPRANLVNTWLTPDIKLTNGAMLSKLGGWTDWRVPTTEDIQALQVDKMADGLAKWSESKNTTIFAPEKVIVQGHDDHYGSEVGVITPMLVDPTAPGTGDRVFDLYTAMPGDTKLTKLPKAASDGQVAGRLFVVRDFILETEDGGGMPADQPVEAVKSTRAKTPKQARLGDFDPSGESKTYRTPGVCSAAGNAYTVPANVTALRVRAQGGKGGTGNKLKKAHNDAPSGGRGALVDAITPVVPGSTVYIQVASDGIGLGDDYTRPGTAGAGGGGVGGSGTVTQSGSNGSGGGGMSGISTSKNCDQWLLVAAGGGGSGDSGISGFQGDWSAGTNGGRGGDADAYIGNVHATNGANVMGTNGSTVICPAGHGKEFPGRGGGDPGDNGWPIAKCGNWGGDGDWFLGGKGADGQVRGGSEKDKTTVRTPGAAGGGGGAGFWNGGGGGASGANGGSGAGGGGGVSYVTDPTEFGIDPATVSLTLADPATAPSVTITPLSGRVDTSVSVTVDQTTITPGGQLTLTASLPNGSNAQGAFYLDDVETGTSRVMFDAVNGKGTLTTYVSNLMWAEGDHQFRIRYSGYGPFGPGVSKPVTITVARTTPTVRVGLSASTVPAGRTPTVTVTLPKDATGQIGLYSDTVGGLGIADINKGAAVFTTFTKPLPAGTHQLWAWYDGNDTYAGRNSEAVTLTVTN